LANETANPVTIRLAVSGFGDERPEELAELTAYRLVQQSTFNAIRHGRPKSIDVALDWTGGEISVEISDDGTGFVLTDAERQRATGRHGIANLYDRVYAVGGQIDIETSPGSGTRVRATIPTGDAIGPGGEPEHTAYEPDLRERGSL
jgi:signal transduction histidine kinase